MLFMYLFIYISIFYFAYCCPVGEICFCFILFKQRPLINVKYANIFLCEYPQMLQYINFMSNPVSRIPPTSTMYPIDTLDKQKYFIDPWG